MRSFPKTIRIIAAILIATFFAQDIAWANPDILEFSRSPSNLQIPSFFQTISPEAVLETTLARILRGHGYNPAEPTRLIVEDEGVRMRINLPAKDGLVECAIVSGDGAESHYTARIPQDGQISLIPMSPGDSARAQQLEQGKDGNVLSEPALPVTAATEAHDAVFVSAPSTPKAKPASRFVREARTDPYLTAEAEKILKRKVGEALRFAEGKEGLKILDLMSGAHTYLPDSVNADEVIGVGLNPEEMNGNIRLSGYLVQDLNVDADLPVEWGGRFDAVIITSGMAYLEEEAVKKFFAEVSRVLKPGGVLIIAFGDGYYEAERTRVWDEADQNGRASIVVKWIDENGSFDRIGHSREYYGYYLDPQRLDVVTARKPVSAVDAGIVVNGATVSSPAKVISRAVSGNAAQVKNKYKAAHIAAIAVSIFMIGLSAAMRGQLSTWMTFPVFYTLFGLIGHYLASRLDGDRKWSRFAVAGALMLFFAAVYFPLYADRVMTDVADFGVFSHSLRPLVDIFVWAQPFHIFTICVMGLRERAEGTHIDEGMLSRLWSRRTLIYLYEKVKLYYSRDGLLKVITLFWFPIIHFAYYILTHSEYLQLAAVIMPVFLVISAAFFVQKPGHDITPNPAVNRILKRSYAAPIIAVVVITAIAYLSGHGTLALGNIPRVEGLSCILTIAIGYAVHWAWTRLVNRVFFRPPAGPDLPDAGWGSFKGGPGAAWIGDDVWGGGSYGPDDYEKPKRRRKPKSDPAQLELDLSRSAASKSPVTPQTPLQLEAATAPVPRDMTARHAAKLLKDIAENDTRLTKSVNALLVMLSSNMRNSTKVREARVALRGDIATYGYVRSRDFWQLSEMVSRILRKWRMNPKGKNAILGRLKRIKERIDKRDAALVELDIPFYTRVPAEWPINADAARCAVLLLGGIAMELKAAADKLSEYSKTRGRFYEISYDICAMQEWINKDGDHPRKDLKSSELALRAMAQHNINNNDVRRLIAKLADKIAALKPLAEKLRKSRAEAASGVEFSMVNMPYKHILLSATPVEGDDLEAQAQSLLLNIDKTLAARGCGRSSIVRQTIFLKNLSDKNRCRAIMKNYYGRAPPPAISYVIQPPASGQSISIEMIAVPPGSGISVTRISRNITIVGYDGIRWAHVAGLEPREGIADTYEQALDVFEQMKDTLTSNGFKFENILRIWIYQGKITGSDGDERQRYDKLNEARWKNFKTGHEGGEIKFLQDFIKRPLPEGIFPYPASTGISMSDGSFVMECVAISTKRDDVEIVPIENPRQTPVYYYSGKHLEGDKFNPLFSRSMEILIGKNRMSFVSGTASIIGEGNVGKSVEDQTEEAIENIRLVLDKAGLGLKDVAQLRVYILDSDDYEKVKEIVESRFGETAKLYTIAGVCRKQLLVELEAVAYSDIPESEALKTLTPDEAAPAVTPERNSGNSGDTTLNSPAAPDAGPADRAQNGLSSRLFTIDPLTLCLAVLCPAAALVILSIIIYLKFKRSRAVPATGHSVTGTPADTTEIIPSREIIYDDIKHSSLYARNAAEEELLKDIPLKWAVEASDDLMKRNSILIENIENARDRYYRSENLPPPVKDMEHKIGHLTPYDITRELIKNAFDAYARANSGGYPVEGPIRLRVLKNNGEVIIEVSDKGIGFSKVVNEYDDLIVESNRVVMKRWKRPYLSGGARIGLMCSKAVAQVHGGRLEILPDVDGFKTTVRMIVPDSAIQIDGIPQRPAYPAGRDTLLATAGIASDAAVKEAEELRRQEKPNFIYRFGRVLAVTIAVCAVLYLIYVPGGMGWYPSIKDAASQASLFGVIKFPSVFADIFTGVMIWGICDAIGQYLNKGKGINFKQSFALAGFGIFQGLATHMLFNSIDLLPILPWPLAQMLLRTGAACLGGLVISLVFARATSMARRLLGTEGISADKDTEKEKREKDRREWDKTEDVLRIKLFLAPFKTFIVVNILPPAIRVLSEQIWDYFMTIVAAYIMNREGPIFAKHLSMLGSRLNNRPSVERAGNPSSPESSGFSVMTFADMVANGADREELIKELARIELEAFGYGGTVKSAGKITEFENNIRYHADRNRIHIARRGGELSGFVIIGKESSGYVCVFDLAVDPSFQQEDIGTRIMDYVREWCRINGTEYLEFALLKVEKDKVRRPLGFYKKYFRRLGMKLEWVYGSKAVNVTRYFRVKLSENSGNSGDTTLISAAAESAVAAPAAAPVEAPGSSVSNVPVAGEFKNVIERIKEGNFTDDELYSIRKEYLTRGSNVDGLKNEVELFSSLVLDRPNEGILSQSTDADISGVYSRTAAAIENIRVRLGRIFGPEKALQCISYANDCLETMHRWMPEPLFRRFYLDNPEVYGHAMPHVLDVLDSAVSILENSSREFRDTMDVEALFYAVIMHDLSCTIHRENHYENSAIWLESILGKDKRFEESRIKKISAIAAAHRKASDGLPREEHKRFPEAMVLHDADMMRASLDIDRIYGAWAALSEAETISTGEPVNKFFNPELSVDDRIGSIKAGSDYRKSDGVTAIALQAWVRRDPGLCLTEGAKKIMEDAPKDLSVLVDFIESNRLHMRSYYHMEDADIDRIIDILRQIFERLHPAVATAGTVPAPASKPEQFLRNIVDTKELTQNMIEGILSELFSNKKLTLAFDRKISGLQSAQLTVLLEQLNKWKDSTARSNEKMRTLLDNLAIFEYDDLKRELDKRGIDANAKNAVIMAYEPGAVDASGDVSGLGSAIRPVHIIEKDGSFPADKYYPLLEMVTVSLAKELLQWDDKELKRALATSNINVDTFGIEAEIDKVSGVLVFRVLPKIECYSNNDRISRYTRLMQFLRAA